MKLLTVRELGLQRTLEKEKSKVKLFMLTILSSGWKKLFQFKLHKSH